MRWSAARRRTARQWPTAPANEPRTIVHHFSVIVYSPLQPASPGEAGECDSGRLGRLDGQVRRRTHGHHGGESSGPGLLHDLEAGAAADVEGEVGRRHATVEQQLPDDLV